MLFYELFLLLQLQRKFHFFYSAGLSFKIRILPKHPKGNFLGILAYAKRKKT